MQHPHDQLHHYGLSYDSNTTRNYPPILDHTRQYTINWVELSPDHDSPLHCDTSIYFDQKCKAILNNMYYVKEKDDPCGITKRSLMKLYMPLFIGPNQ